MKHSKLDSNERDGDQHVDPSNESRYTEIENAFQMAFEDEDNSKALKYWNELKHYQESSIHLSMVIRAMRSCNKGAYFISTELRNFFKAHPHIVSVELLNDLLEPVARRLDDAQLADMIARMIPTLKVEKDPRTFEILLTMHVANRNLAKAQDVMTEMKELEASFTPCATVAVMTMGLQTRNFELVLKAFTKLRSSWDDRRTWAVSLFTVERHKASTLKQIVELAHETRKICELLPAMVGMTVPEEVLVDLRAKLARMSDVDVATSFAMLKKSCSGICDDSIYNAVMERLKLPSEASVPLGGKKLPCADSDASTSEGSRSDSEEDSSPEPVVRPPPGLVRTHPWRR